MISTPGPLELLVILGLALLLLGPSRLPEAARSAGKAMRELRDALSGDRDDEDEFGDPDELAESGPAAEAQYREEVADERGEPELEGGGPAAEAATREATPAGTEGGDPAPPPVS